MSTPAAGAAAPDVGPALSHPTERSRDQRMGPNTFPKKRARDWTISVMASRAILVAAAALCCAAATPAVADGTGLNAIKYGPVTLTCVALACVRLAALRAARLCSAARPPPRAPRLQSRPRARARRFAMCGYANPCTFDIPAGQGANYVMVGARCHGRCALASAPIWHRAAGASPRALCAARPCGARARRARGRVAAVWAHAARAV